MASPLLLTACVILVCIIIWMHTTQCANKYDGFNFFTALSDTGRMIGENVVKYHPVSYAINSIPRGGPPPGYDTGPYRGPLVTYPIDSRQTMMR